MMECDPQQNKYVLDLRKGHLSTHFLRNTGVRQTLKRKLDTTAEIIDLDELGEGLPVNFIECDEPQSFNSKAKRSILQKQISVDDEESITIDQQLTQDEATELNWHMLDTDKGQTEGSPSCKGMKKEGYASQQLAHILELLFEDGTEPDQHYPEVDKSDSTINSLEETVREKTSKRTPGHVAGIKHLSGEETPIRSIEPWSLTTLPTSSNEILEDKGNAVEINYSSLDITLEDAQKNEEHTVTVATERVHELVEESPVDAVGHTTTSASQPTSFQTMKSLPQQEIEEETVVSDAVTQKLLLSEDVLQITNEGIRENDGTNIQFISETCIEDTSERENKSEKDISLECLRKHFGRSLNDAAKSFGVSRSTFKRICRGHGIKRWQYGKRRMDDSTSSGLGRKLHNDRSSRKNFSCSSSPPMQDSVLHTNQNSTKMTIKATYNDVTIRFELPVSSGIAELEDNVIERLHLERKSFSIKYQDDEGDWVLIACDKDLQECMKVSGSSHKTTIKMLLDPPINYYVLESKQ